MCPSIALGKHPRNRNTFLSLFPTNHLNFCMESMTFIFSYFQIYKTRSIILKSIPYNSNKESKNPAILTTEKTSHPSSLGLVHPLLSYIYA